jgi:hypothetical protein
MDRHILRCPFVIVVFIVVQSQLRLAYYVFTSHFLSVRYSTQLITANEQNFEPVTISQSIHHTVHVLGPFYN